jgi:hypothetical protein
MRKGFSIASLLFVCLLLFVVVGIITLLGNKALKEGIINIQSDIAPQEQQTALEVAKKAIQSRTLYKTKSWGEIELNNGEWPYENSDIEIRYFYNDLKENNSFVTFYVIVYPKEEIAGITFSSNKKCSTLALGAGPRNKLPAPPNGGFAEGYRILSPFGVIHYLILESEGFVNVDPSLNQIDTDLPLLLLEDKKAIVEAFSLPLDSVK